MIGAWSAETFAAYRAAPEGPRKRMLANVLYRENEPLVKTLVAQMIGAGEGRPGRRIPAALRRIHRSELVESWEDAMGIAGIAFAKFLRDYDPGQGKISFFLGMKIKYELQCLIERSTNVRTPREAEADFVPRGFERFEADGDLERAMGSSGLEVGEEQYHAEMRAGAVDRPAPDLPPRSAIDDFFERRCTWSASARVAIAPFVATFKRHAREIGASSAVDRLLSSARERGARSVRMRTPWSSSAPALAGVRVSQTSENKAA